LPLGAYLSSPFGAHSELVELLNSRSSLAVFHYISRPALLIDRPLFFSLPCNHSSCRFYLSTCGLLSEAPKPQPFSPLVSYKSPFTRPTLNAPLSRYSFFFSATFPLGVAHMRLWLVFCPARLFTVLRRLPLTHLPSLQLTPFWDPKFLLSDFECALVRSRMFGPVSALRKSIPLPYGLSQKARCNSTFAPFLPCPVDATPSPRIFLPYPLRHSTSTQRFESVSPDIVLFPPH